MQKQIVQIPHCLTKKCPAIYIYIFYFFKKSFIGPPLPLNEFRASMDMGKRDSCSKKNWKREKRAVLRHTHSFSILWVAAGLARPATAAAAATATAAATFIAWIDLAAPPVNIFFLRLPENWNRHQQTQSWTSVLLLIYCALTLRMTCPFRFGVLSCPLRLHDLAVFLSYSSLCTLGMQDSLPADFTSQCAPVYPKIRGNGRKGPFLPSFLLQFCFVGVEQVM